MAASLRQIIRQIAREINPIASTQQLANHLAAVDELDRPADPAHVFVVGVDAERRVNGPEKITPRDRPFCNFLPAGIGFANDLAAPDAATSESHVERARI